jgi:hypothetical protein
VREGKVKEKRENPPKKIDAKLYERIFQPPPHLRILCTRIEMILVLDGALAY